MEERIKELEAYLQATGLRDYQLSAEENRVLAEFNDLIENPHTHTHRLMKFRIGDLFEIETGSLLSSAELFEGETYRVSAKSDNNGILGSFSSKNLPNARHFENFITVNFFGDSFYHPYEASVEMKVHTLKIKNQDFTRSSGLFISSVIRKVFFGIYGYGNQLSSSKLKNGEFFIQLSAKNSQPDFEFMETFIRAVEKLAIADVVKWLDAQIEATKQVASRG